MQKAEDFHEKKDKFFIEHGMQILFIAFMAAIIIMMAIEAAEQSNNYVVQQESEVEAD